MPKLTVPATPSQLPRYDLTPGDETTNFADGTFVPHLPGAEVGDLILLGDYLRVYLVAAEDERGHRIDFDHRLPEPKWVA